jgi:hypothetical protein
MSAVEMPPRRHPPGYARSAPASWRDRLGRLAASPSFWVAACVAGALITWAALPTVPSYDPWSWIVWGREVSDPHLPFTISGGPSWKPLPFAFTVVWGLFGGAAPTLWLLTARAGGLLGIVAAARLAHRLSGGGRAGAAAAVLAGAGIVLTEQWMYYFLRGASETGLIACTLWAVDRLLAGRRGQAFWLGVAVALIRPESWPFLALYAAWLWFADPGWRTPARRATLLGGLVLVAAGWFGPPWIGSGDPWLAAQHAAAYDGRLGPEPLRALLTRGANDQVAPLLVAGIAFVVIAWLRDRNRVVLSLGLGVIGWWAVVVGMTGAGYPGLERFYLPAAALITVLGACGVVCLVRLAADRAARNRTAIAAASLVVLVAISVAGSWERISDARANVGLAAQAARMIAGLDRAATAAGGTTGVLPCGDRSFVAVNHSLQTALAWELHVDLERVSGVMNAPGLDFIGPSNPADGVPPAVDPRLTGARVVARAAAWRVVARTDPRHPELDACVGR